MEMWYKILGGHDIQYVMVGTPLKKMNYKKSKKKLDLFSRKHP